MKTKSVFRLETQRLYLREMTEQDAEQAYLLNLDPDVIKYTGDVAFESVEEARLFLKQYDHYKRYGLGRWAVIRKSDEVLLGWCGLKFHPNENEYDLGFRFFKKYWRQGYASEAAQACLKWAFEAAGIEKVIANVDEENTASRMTLLKLKLQCLPEEGRSSRELKYLIEKKTYFDTL